MAAVKKPRIALLDEIRGFCILCMVFYHAFYLLGTRGGIAWLDGLYRFFQPVQLLFASVFVCISGICTNFSRSPLRRGLILAGIAVCITLLSVFLLPRIGFDGLQDKFGILHLLSCCMISAAVFKGATNHVPPAYGIAVCILLYAVSVFLLSGRLTIPPALQNDWLCPFGLHTNAFYSVDYFPLFPHVYVFFAGIQIGKLLRQREPSASAYRTHIPFFAFFGRHSLTVYLLHVPCLLLIQTIFERI